VKYIYAGNIMSDSIQLADGSVVGPYMGGPSVFALAGGKLYADNMLLVAGVGLDFDETYGKWMDENGLDQSQVWRMTEKTKHNIIVYNDDGSYGYRDLENPLRYWQNFGYCEVNPDRFDMVCEEGDVVYYPYDTFNMVYWDNFFKVKEKKKFKMMWEIHANSAIPSQLERIKQVLKKVEMFSINFNEMKTLMGAETEEEAIAFIKSIFDGFTAFRVGSKGMYTILGDKHWFIPSINSDKAVDATGCGNCSTGAAMYAFHATGDPVMAGIMGNIAAGYNVLQYGPYLHFTKEERQKALALAQKLYDEYTAK